MQSRKKTLQLIQGRAFALMLLCFEVGIMFAYGYGSYFPTYTATNPQSDYSDLIILYTFTAMLAILGYGLIIAYSDNSAAAGLVTTLIVVGVSVQLTPLLLSFWYRVFNGFNGSNVEISLSVERTTMVLCVSLLTALTSLVGRLGKVETFIMILIFNLGWTLSYIVTQYVQEQHSPTNPLLYDDFGTNYVYVFAGFFALVSSLVLNIKPGKVLPTGSRHSAFIALIGTGFIFACFPFTGILYNSTASSNIYRRSQGPLNIYFALTASVICTYISSLIFGNLKIGVRESLVGVLSGGVTIAVVAGTINNIGACIAIGAFSGIVSGFWLRVVHPRINRLKSVDHLGIFGPILVCSIIGGLGLSPAMYQSYIDQNTVASGLGAQISSSDYMSYQLAYIGIAAGTAIVAGLMAGFLSLAFRDPSTDFQFTKMMSSDFGLYREQQGGEAYRQEQNPPKPNNDTNNALKQDHI